MAYKTLILVDNSSTLSSLNRNIIQETVKHIVKNLSDESSVSVAEFSGGVNYITDYDDSIDTKLRLIDELEYKDRTTSYTDALMEVIEDWHEKDFADRDIILISDGKSLEGAYTTEELYFLLDSCGYPIYVLGCAEEGIDILSKKLKSISRISGGTYFQTDMYSGEASIEKVFGDAIIGEIMDHRKSLENEGGEENLSDDGEDIVKEETEEILVQNEFLGENAMEEDLNSSIIYTMPDDSGNLLSKPYILIPLGLILCILFVIFLMGFIKKKRRERDEEEFLMSTLKHINQKSSELNKEERSDVSLTRALNETPVDDDGGTRLLYQAMEGVDITLEDRADPTKYYRACIRDKIIVGRSAKFCDIVISHDDSVSSKHCELFLRGDDLYVRDLSSSNGTVVNQQKVYQEIKLNSGDILKLGQLSLFLQIIRRGNCG